MKKTIIAILSFLLLTSAYNFQKADSFEVQISYIGLPNPITTNYLVKDNQIKVFEEFYNPNYDSTSFRNVHVYSDTDQSVLTDFLKRVDWDTIPKELITPTIDGYQFNVDIKLEGKKYHFNIDNSYHPTFDSLLTICNQMIPKKKVRNEYKLYYKK